MVTTVNTTRANNTILRKLLVVSVLMFGFGFAMVPFYKKLCEVTGLNSIIKPDTVTNTQVDTGRSVTMEFDSNVRNDLPWTFRPLEKSVRFHPGELVQVEFEVRNNSDKVLTGQAIPSWGPQIAGKHLRKLDCFCFVQQTLQPHETRRMPVLFVIETTLPDDVNYVTMSYTFFQVEGRARNEALPSRPEAEGMDGKAG
ncbi:MAG TPA: cytochrome c oxidase assembly protein [Burkholderiales bacterium]|nr:cytochrome c oxidase assembly protein [Burkholderiales bacterium]